MKKTDSIEKAETNIETQEKKATSIIIFGLCVLIIIFLVLIVALVNSLRDEEKTNTNKKTQSTTKTTTVAKNDAMVVKNNDYGENSQCGVDYFSPAFALKDYKLYALLDKENEHTSTLTTSETIENQNAYFLRDDMKQIFIVEHGQCGYQFAFVQSTSGTIYYINNDSASSLTQFELVLISELKDITDIRSEEKEEETIAYAYDKNKKKTDLTKIIEKYAKLEV